MPPERQGRSQESTRTRPARIQPAAGTAGWPNGPARVASNGGSIILNDGSSYLLTYRNAATVSAVTSHHLSFCWPQTSCWQLACLSQADVADTLLQTLPSPRSTRTRTRVVGGAFRSVMILSHPPRRIRRTAMVLVLAAIAPLPTVLSRSRTQHPTLQPPQLPLALALPPTSSVFVEKEVI
jgi:hypothetical protein